ncbi:MAG: SRPBCC domain-containing protein [Acidimicrobiia bacterium]|jgi:uncharacterized protein YndB with AHSA1/START domain
MVDIRHRIGVDAPPSAVYDQLATTEGLEQWWTQDVRGRAATGEKLAFHFGSPERYMVMEVVELSPNERVAWRCIDGPDEWVDTDVTFDVREGDDETLVLFTHRGWREPVEFMHHCSTKWASYLIGLKQGLETGHAQPFPHDVKVSNWD